MAVTFGLLCNQPNRAHEALAAVRHALVVDLPVSRWGIGYVQGQVLLQRRPHRAGTALDFFDALQGVSSDYIIGHACDEDGLTGADNTPPFRFRQWLFSATGAHAPLGDVREQLLNEIPVFLQRTILGHTDAELLFYLFISSLYDTGGIDDPNLPLHACREALSNTIRILERQNGEPAVNQIVTNSRSMVALRYGPPMFFCRLKLPSANETSTFKGILVLCGAPPSGGGFEEIPVGAAVHISRDLRVEVIASRS